MDFVPHFYLHGRMAVILVAALITLWLRLPARKPALRPVFKLVKG